MRTAVILLAVVGLLLTSAGILTAQTPTTDTTAPSVTQAPAQSLVQNSTLGTSTVPVKISWYATDYGGSGVVKYELQQSTNGGAYTTVTLSSGAVTGLTRSLSPGKTYRFQVRAQDQTGNWSDWKQGTGFRVDVLQESDSATGYTGAWSTESSSGASGGGLAYASAAGDSARATFTGARNIAWVSTKGPDRGNAEVWVDGTKSVVADSYYSTSQPRKLLFVQNGLSPSQSHSLEARVRGTKNTASSGTRVDIDAFVVLSATEQLPPNDSPVLVGAGDIAGCSSTGDEATAALLDGIPGTIFTTGDNAYEKGTDTEFKNCYDPTWGRHKARTRPTTGNHEYSTLNASGYFNYFGPAAGDPDKGYYSYDFGDWHIVALNGMCEKVGGCEANAPMVTWLKNDLAANPRTCTLAYWHHPRFSSGEHGGDAKMGPTWDALYEANADVVVNGHDHDYERFAPQDPSGTADSARGIRQFVVGTGGRSVSAFGTIEANSELRDSATRGVLKLTLNSGSYDWEFVPVANKTFTDSGSGTCVTGADTTNPDTTKPTITLSSPTEGATYGLGQSVNADYSCSDDTSSGSDLTCEGTVPNGSPLDTSSVGTKTFTVTAEDKAGNMNSATRTYTVKECSIEGTSGNDILEGTSGDDVICGLGGNDTIKGLGGSDTIKGGDGTDTLLGGDGDDKMDGGSGTDTVSYQDSATGVEASLLSRTATGEGSDAFVSIEHLTGSADDDKLTGSSGANNLTGLAGADTLSGGGGNDTLFGGLGDDTVDGGLGTDVASYRDSATVVEASLATNTATGEGSDTFAGIENLTGSLYNDKLTGSKEVNTLKGGSGSDTISGLEGADTLLGESGNDTLGGGLDNDSLVGATGSDTLLGEDGDDSLNSKDATIGNDALDGGTGTNACSTDATEKSIINCS